MKIENYRVWQHGTGTAPMSMAAAQLVAEQMERAVLTPGGGITQADHVEVMPADIAPGSIAWHAYRKTLREAGKRRA